MLFLNDFGWSELILRSVCWSVFFVNILLLLMYISISRSQILSFDISYSNLIDVCFVFNLFKRFSRSVLLSAHIKNIPSINLRYISENVLINEYLNFLSKWSMKIFVCEGANIVPMTSLLFASSFCDGK